MSGNTIDLGVGTDTIKFTTVTNSDTVTVTSTTISGAKSITYEAAATAAAITTGAGADLVVFEESLTLGTDIVTNSGNDSIQFLKNSDVSLANLGAGADSVYGAQIVSDSTISGGGQDTFHISTLSNSFLYGGDDIDSVAITGSLIGATVDFGAGDENFTLSVGATSSSIAGGAGNDTFVVTAANLQTGTTIAGGSGNDTVYFGAELLAVSYKVVLAKTRLTSPVLLTTAPL